MPTLYTSLYIEARFTPTQLNAYTTIQYAPGNTTTSADIWFSASGTVNFLSKVGSQPLWVMGFTGTDAITGGNGADTLLGARGSDALYGGNGDDVLIGDSNTFGDIGNDRIYGGAGADWLAGDAGNDALYGGDGNDAFAVGESLSGDDSFYGGAGDDWLDFGHVFQVQPDYAIQVHKLVLNAAASIEDTYIDTQDVKGLWGTSGSDSWDLSGTAFWNWDGNAVTEGAAVNMQGGNDRYVGSRTGEVVTFTSGNDTVSMGLGDDTVVLADGILTGATLYGGGGNDTLAFGVAGKTTTIHNFSAASLVHAGSFETLALQGTLIGTSGADVWDLSAITQAMWIPRDGARFDMGSGNDRFVARPTDPLSNPLSGYRASVLGNLGNDTLIGSTAGDVLYGGSNNDRLYGGTGDDLISGGTGFDSLSAGEGNDTLVLDDWTSGDTIYGGAGLDTLTIAQTATVTLSYASLPAVAALGIEVLTFGSHVSLRGTAGNDIWDLHDLVAFNATGAIQLLDGNDRFTAAPSAVNVAGGAGNDTITGSARADTIDGGSGNDLMTGGLGNDLYVVDSANDVVVEAANGGLDEMTSALTLITLADNVEIFHSTALGAVHVIGNAQDNQIYAHLAGDTLEGGAGDDIYYLASAGPSVIELPDAGHDTAHFRLQSANDRLLAWAGVEDFVIEAEAAPGGTTYGGTFTGNGLDNNILNNRNLVHAYGGAGNDTMESHTAANAIATLEGGEGDDQMVAGGTTPWGVLLLGNEGDDTYDLRAITGDFSNYTNSAFAERADEGFDTVILGGGVTFEMGSKTPSGTPGTGYDDLAEKIVIDSQFGQVSQVKGAAGTLEIQGGDGLDRMIAVSGHTLMTGGNGADTFVFTHGTADDGTLVHIADFEHVVDRIELGLRGMGSPGTLFAGQLAAVNFKDIALAAADANDYILYDDRTGELFYDRDALGTLFSRVLVAVLDNHATLQASDITLSNVL